MCLFTGVSASKSATIERMFGVLDGLNDTIDKLLADEQPPDVIGLRRGIERLEFLWLRSVREAERSGVWQADGFVSSSAWLRERCGLTHTEACSAIKLARTLEAMPALAAAFETGAITRRHCLIVSLSRTPGRDAAFRELDATFTAAARHLSPEQLRTVVGRACDAIDGDNGLGEERNRLGRRALYLSDLLDGMGALNGTLDPETNELLHTALDAFMEADQHGNDARTAPHRRCDALADICRAALGHLPDGPGRHNPPHLSAVVGLDIIETRGGRELADLIRTEAAHGPLSRITLERLACDCKLSRIITDGDSQPLDVGRATRTVTDAQWKALVVRDGGCVEPGCDRPPGWCQAHHKQWWQRDHGKTDLNNLELRCHRHHRDKHLNPPSRT
jgi:hypothetical protein